MPSGTDRILTRPTIGGRWAAAIYTVLLVVALLPLASTILPPLVDYPNHLSRMAILAADGRDALLNKFYTTHWAALPNLAMDAVIPPLSRVMPLLMAGRLYIAAMFILFSGAIVLLHRTAWGHWSWWSPLGFLLLYNRIMLWGFLNYLMGLSLALCVMVIWLALERKPVARLALAIPLTTAVFFCHIAAFAVLCLFIAGCEIVPVYHECRARLWAALCRRAGGVFLCVIFPIAIFVLWQPHTAGGTIAWGHYWRKADLFFSAFDAYNRPFDVVCFTLFLGLLIFAGIKGRVHPRLGGATGLLALAYLASPDVLFTGSNADHRLPLAIFAMLIAAIDPGPLSLRVQRGLALATLAIFMLRMGFVEIVWARSDAIYAADLATLNLVPEGARLAISSPDGSVHAGREPAIHLPVLAIPFRHAFVPTLFAYPAQQPVQFRPPYDQLAAATSAARIWEALVKSGAAYKANVVPLFKEYDDVVFFDDKPFTVPANPCLTRLGGSPKFQLFRVEHDGAKCSW